MGADDTTSPMPSTSGAPLGDLPAAAGDAHAADAATELRVWRGRTAGAGRYDVYRVPYEEGMSVLDALVWVRGHVDSSLAFRYGCVNANACKTCMALVDGQVAYTCTTRLSPAGSLVEPLPKRPLIRDLVTDTVPDDEKLAAAAPSPRPDR